MRTKITIAGVLVLIIFNVVLLYRYHNISIKNTISTNKISRNRYLELREKELMSENILLSFNLQDQKLNTITFNKYLDGRRKLFYFFSEKSCLACVENDIKTLQNYPNLNITILCKYSNLRHMLIFKNMLNIDFPCYNIDTLNLQVYNDKKNIPFLFTATKNSKSDFVMYSIQNKNTILTYLNRAVKICNNY